MVRKKVTKAVWDDLSIFLFLQLHAFIPVFPF